MKLFSALKKQGIDEASQLLWQWAHPEVTDAPTPKTVAPVLDEPENLDETENLDEPENLDKD